jgi:hypothetical protein
MHAAPPLLDLLKPKTDGSVGCSDPLPFPFCTSVVPDFIGKYDADMEMVCPAV